MFNSIRWSSARRRLDEQEPVDEQSQVEAGGGRWWMNSSPWRLEEVNAGDEQYPMESRFAVRHRPPNEQDPYFDRSAPTQVCFLRFVVRHTPPNQQDPVSTIGGPTEVRFLHFAVCQTPPNEQDPVSTVASRTQGCFLRSTVCQASFRSVVPSKLVGSR